MSSDYLELFWTLLEDRNLEQLRSTVPRHFDWSALHPKRNTTILVEALIGFPEAEEESRCLGLIEWLVGSGASFSQKSGASTLTYTVRKSTDPSTKIAVPYKGHSALSFIAAWRQEMKGKEIWKKEALYLRKAVDRLAKAAKASGRLQARPHARRRASVDEGIIEIWEKFLHATASHDLTIETADGCVTAHAQMLQEASPVVQAMLGAPMREQKTQHIQLPDTNSSAVTLFLETLYTCSAQGDPHYKTALAALDLAHRWQVEAVVAILADLMIEQIDEQSFGAIAEHAALKNLEPLKRACQNFGSQSAAIRDKIKKGQMPKAVQDLFEESSQPAKKRKRL